MKRKLNIKDEIFPFTLTLLARNKLCISGVKNILLSGDETLRFRLPSGKLEVHGRSLFIREIGGGDVYIEGEIGGIQFEE